jgi:hypothetical protein
MAAGRASAGEFDDFDRRPNWSSPVLPAQAGRAVEPHKEKQWVKT